MATAQKIRDLIAQTTTGSVRTRVPREVREEVCRYAGRRPRGGAAWALIARETGLEPRELQRWGGRARLAAPVASRRAPSASSPSTFAREIEPKLQAVSIAAMMRTTLPSAK